MKPTVELITYEVSTLVLRNGLGLVNRRIEALSCAQESIPLDYAWPEMICRVARVSVVDWTCLSLQENTSHP